MHTYIQTYIHTYIHTYMNAYIQWDGVWVSDEPHGPGMYIFESTGEKVIYLHMYTYACACIQIYIYIYIYIYVACTYSSPLGKR